MREKGESIRKDMMGGRKGGRREEGKRDESKPLYFYLKKMSVIT